MFFNLSEYRLLFLDRLLSNNWDENSISAGFDRREEAPSINSLILAFLYDSDITLGVRFKWFTLLRRAKIVLFCVRRRRDLGVSMIFGEVLGQVLLPL